VVIGLGIVLVVIGAILVFAVEATVQGIDLTTVGWIVLGAGVLVFLIGLVMAIPRRRRARTTAVTTDQYGRQYVTERDDRIDGI
jgi:membrane-bound ClpP family serine protease